MKSAHGKYYHGRISYYQHILLSTLIHSVIANSRYAVSLHKKLYYKSIKTERDHLIMYNRNK